MKNTEQLEEGKCQEWELILLNILKQIMTNEIALNLGYVKVVEFFDKREQQAILNERELSIKRLEACLMGTHDVVDLDVDPPTKHITTIAEIQDHIRGHIAMAKEKLTK